MACEGYGEFSSETTETADNDKYGVHYTKTVNKWQQTKLHWMKAIKLIQTQSEPVMEKICQSVKFGFVATRCKSWAWPDTDKLARLTRELEQLALTTGFVIAVRIAHDSPVETIGTCTNPDLDSHHAFII